MALGFATLLFTMTLIGCGGGGTEKDKVSDTGGKDKADVKQAKKTAVRPGKGTFKGKVTLTGDKPDIAKLNEEIHSLMAKADAMFKPVCIDKAPQDQKDQQDWRIGPDNGVKDVFVFFKPTSTTYFAFEEGDEAVKAAKKAIDLQQPHCAFVPHALTAFGGYRDSKNVKKDTGQKLFIHNTSGISHNTKFGDFNDTIPPTGKEVELNGYISNSPIQISCKVHPWMDANMLVLDHPYAAVTNDKGEFEIKDVPKGKVNVVVWHGKAGYATPAGAKGEEIELKDGENPKNFEIKAK